MKPHRETLLCRYHYDPLDRLADCTPTAQTSSQRFYLKDRLTTEIQGALQCSIMQHEDQLLAQQQRQNGTQASRLLATDQQRSVLAILDATRSHHLAYAPYGHRIPENGLLSLLGFNGERPDPVTGHYLLGNGYRAFNPVLMRFNSPDSWSPFGEGGLNAYGYCVGDPVNQGDKTGHKPGLLSRLFSSSGASANRYSNLRTSDTSLTNSPTTAVLSDSAGTALNTGTSRPLLRLEKTTTINKTKDPIARNQLKLKNVESELSDLTTNEDAVVNRIMSQYSDVLMTADIYEEIVRADIPNRIRQLQSKQAHYTAKIFKLNERSSKVRQP